MPTKRESKKEQGRGESLIVPMTVIMMRQGYDYWQNKVLLAIIDKLQPYIREGLQIDLFGIQEDIILSIRYKDLGIRRADYSKFRSRLSILSFLSLFQARSIMSLIIVIIALVLCSSKREIVKTS